MSLKDPIIPKEVNNADKWREVKGIIKIQLKYARKAFWVNFIVKYKTAAVPLNVSTKARDTEIAVAVNAAINARIKAVL